MPDTLAPPANDALPLSSRSELRFLACGSVDDGKSTLIGRLLYDSKMIFEDQLAALEADSKRVGTQGQEIDFALLVDGLAAEREQGITIDVVRDQLVWAVGGGHAQSPSSRRKPGSPEIESARLPHEIPAFAGMT